MKKTLVLFVFYLAVFHLYAQKTPLNAEIQLENSADDYFLIPVGSDGLIVFYMEGETNNGNREWYFIKYSTQFKEVWTKKETMKYSMEFVKFDLNKNSKKLYLLFSSVASTALSKGKEYNLMMLDTDKGKIEIYTGVSPLSFLINDFAVIGDKAFIGGISYYNFWQSCMISMCLGYIDMLTVTPTIPHKAMLVYMNIDDQSTQPVPYTFKGESTITDFSVPESREYLDIVVRNTGKTTATYLDRYDKKGNNIYSLELEAKESRINVLTAKVADVAANKKIIIGTYDKYATNSYLDAFANGIYFATADDKGIIDFNLYSFTELKNFFKYMSKKKQDKLDKKISKAKSKGKEYDVNYKLLVHDPVIYEDQYIIIGEAYYPEYEQRCRTTYVNGQAQTTCHTVFVGYRFTHAFIAAFNSRGKMIWDNTFEIQNILTFDLSYKVKEMFLDKDVVLVYNFSGLLQSKIIREGKVIEGKKSTKITTNYKESDIKAMGGSGTEYWYDNYFLAYGYIKVKDKAKTSGKKSRYVFYFNKIEFE